MMRVETKVDVVKNRYYLSFGDNLTLEHAKRLRRQVMADLRQLRPGFFLLAEERTRLRASRDAMRVLDELIRYIAESGLDRCAQVVPGEMVAVIELDRLTRPHGAHSSGTFASAEEAERQLDRSVE